MTSFCVLFGSIYLLVIQSSEAACPDPRFTIITDHSACLSKSVYAQTSGVSAEERAEIVDRHNHWRANVSPTARDMLKMSWDDGVAEVAQAYADNCVYEHDSNYKRIIPGRYNAGQNLAVATGATHSWTARIDDWHSEVDHFSFGSGSTDGTAVGHYTQMVWANSHKIGCGYAYCTNAIFSGSPAHFYVCNYSPAGNIAPNTNRPYTSGTTCADCPNSCSGNLCDCSSHHCYNDGDLNADTCACACTNNAAFYAGDSCALNCTNIGTPSCGYTSLGDWSTAYCSNYANVPFECPVQCNWCPEGDSTSYLTSGTTASSPATSPPSSTVSQGSSTDGTTQGAGGGGRGACLVLNIHLIVFLLFLLLAPL